LHHREHGEPRRTTLQENGNEAEPQMNTEAHGYGRTATVALATAHSEEARVRNTRRGTFFQFSPFSVALRGPLW